MHRMIKLGPIAAAISLMLLGAALSPRAAAAQTPMNPYEYPTAATFADAVMPVSAPVASPAQASAAVRIVDFAFNPQSLSIAAGDSVTWTNTGSAPHTASADAGAWNSGTLAPGASFSQTFTTTGMFNYHCMIHPSMTATIVVTAAAGAVTQPPVTGANPAPQGGPSASYAAGWNLIGVPAGSAVTGASGPLYTFRASDTNYLSVPAGSALSGGAGYWAYFSGPATVALNAAALQPGPIQLPPGHYVMIGNPRTTPVTVAGADSVLTYDSVRGYQATTTLQPGQGAWAYSANGATLTLSAAAAPSSGAPVLHRPELTR